MIKKTRLILGIILLLTKMAFGQTIEECDKIITIPKSIKPEFNQFLAGVKFAVIVGEPKINGHIPAYKALTEYLYGMGFEKVVRFVDQYDQDWKSQCEIVHVSIGFEYDLEKFYNIKMKFISEATGYSWNFESNKIAKAGLYNDPKYNFGQVLREMYAYKKSAFNSNYTMQLPKKKTCWTEKNLKDYYKNNSDKYEGIYEELENYAKSTKFTVALKKINNVYCLIYIKGAFFIGDWIEGELIATLESTATTSLYKANWIYADKSEGIRYISLEGNIFNLYTNKDSKDTYIKLYPTMTDDNANSSSENISSGTGWAATSNGYIVTNYHVVEGAKSIKVRGINGDFSNFFSAKVIIEDKNNDLVIIKIDDPSFITLGTIPYIITNRTSDVGSSVFVLGYPLRATMGDEIKLTNGIVSSKSGFQGDITSYQITAPVQPGNSGGPLFDNNGNIIGIINAKHIGAENASYAIKSAYLMNLLDLLPTPPKLQTTSLVAGKPLTQQVKLIRQFIYIIEIN
jgi:S1-C subfamily serine protease